MKRPKRRKGKMNNRIYKFRVWLEKHSKMVEVSMLALSQSMYPEGAVSLNSDGTVSIFMPSRVPLMQFTGLFDKNGKEIYQKDFLGGIWEGYIDWCEKCKSNELFCPDFGCMQCSGDVTWQEIVEEDGKVELKGNIYENPDLLGDSEK